MPTKAPYASFSIGGPAFTFTLSHTHKTSDETEADAVESSCWGTV